jgi:hypothetical protein
MMFQKYSDRAGRVNAFHLSRRFRRDDCTQKTTKLFFVAMQYKIIIPFAALRSSSF